MFWVQVWLKIRFFLGSGEREGYLSSREMGSVDLHALAQTRMPILMRRDHPLIRPFAPALIFSFWHYSLYISLPKMDRR